MYNPRRDANSDRKNFWETRVLKKAKPMFNANSIKPGIVGLANPLRKCMQSGVLTFKSKPAGYDYSLAV